MNRQLSDYQHLTQQTDSIFKTCTKMDVKQKKKIFRRKKSNWIEMHYSIISCTLAAGSCAKGYPIASTIFRELLSLWVQTQQECINSRYKFKCSGITRNHYIYLEASNEIQLVAIIVLYVCVNIYNLYYIIYNWHYNLPSMFAMCTSTALNKITYFAFQFLGQSFLLAIYTMLQTALHMP